MPEKRVAIVTGSSRGLGRLMGLALARDGAAVVINYRGNPDRARATVLEIESAGGTAIAAEADVRSTEEAGRLVETTVDRFGRVDILVNNAGVSEDGISWKLDRGSWQRSIDANLTAAFLCIQAALVPMREQGYGRIVNISSVVGQVGVPGASAYAASKAGLLGLTKAIAREVVTRGITVNALALGYFEAGMVLRMRPQLQAQIKSDIPMGRFGTADELAHALRFLTSPQASYVTGSTLSVNGGFSMA